MSKKLKRILVALLVIPLLSGVFITANADSNLGIGILKGESGKTINIFPTATSTSRTTYIEASGSYGSDVAVFGKQNNRYKIMIAGYEGWIDQNTINFYAVTEKKLPYGPSHYYLPKPDGSPDYLSHRIKTGRSTSFPEADTTWHPVNDILTKNLKRDTPYFSYDGHYFYENYYNMLLDYRDGTNRRSVNPGTPYFNYYQFLPFRTQSKHTAQNINTFFTGHRKFTSTITTPYEEYDSKTGKANESLLYNSGEWWIETQNKYGSNALLNLGVAANESAWGKSNIAVRTNNLFGHSAFDSNPGSATRYKDVKTSIESHTIDFLNWSYLKPVLSGFSGGYYRGGVLGDKSVGANVFYASDPYWGEKAANQYRLIDRVLGEQDLYSYRVGVKKGAGNDNVRIRKEPNTNSSIVGSLSEKYAPVVILDEVTGQSVSGSTKWYKIQSDHLMDSNRNIVSDNKDKFRKYEYDYATSFAYVHSSLIFEISKESEIPVYEDKLPRYAFEHLDKVGNNLELKLSLALNGVDYSKPNDVETYLEFVSLDTNEIEYSMALPQIKNASELPFELDSPDKLSKKFAWFKGSLNIDEIPDGDYFMQLRSTAGNTMVNGRVVTNISFKNITPSFEGKNKQASIFIDHLINGSPIRINIRNTKNIVKNGTGNSALFNSLHSLTVDSKGFMNISGTSYNINGHYPNKSSVSRNIIIENLSNFKQVKKSLGHYDDAPYNIRLKVPNGTSKDYAWYSGKVDLNEYPNGNYTFYVETNGNIKDFRYINDMKVTKFPEYHFNGRTVKFKVVVGKGYRLEMEVTGSPIKNLLADEIENDLTQIPESTSGQLSDVDLPENNVVEDIISEEDKINE